MRSLPLQKYVLGALLNAGNSNFTMLFLCRSFHDGLIPFTPKKGGEKGDHRTACVLPGDVRDDSLLHSLIFMLQHVFRVQIPTLTLLC